MGQSSRKNLIFCLGIVLLCSFFMNIPLTKAASPVLSIVSDEVNFEEGKDFTAKVVMDTAGESIKKADLIIKYDQEKLKVVDQDAKAGVQISNQNELGAFQKNIADDATGEIHISVVGPKKKGANILLANILFETINPGGTEVKIDVPNSKLFVDSDMETGFLANELIISRIIEDSSGIKILHVQSNYLAVENKIAEVEASFSSEDPVLEFKLFYRTLTIDGKFIGDWQSVDMIKDKNTENKYVGEIPARHVVTPGITYYFTIKTTNRQTTLPRPITIENAYKMKVVTEEEYNDKDGPVITFNPPEAEFIDTVTVIASSSEAKSTIYCTFDGTLPTTSTYIYLNPLILNNSTQIKCMGVDALGNEGEVTTGIYTKKEGDIIASLTADKMEITEGEEVNLTWGTSNATKTSLTPAIGEVSLNGQKNVYPKETTTYSLNATNDEGKTVTKTVTIYVMRGGGGEIEQDYYPPENAETGVGDFFIYFYLLVTSGGAVYKIRKLRN